MADAPGLRVLFLTHSYPRVPGDAAGSFLWHLAVALRDEGVQVHVLAPAAAGLAPHDRFGDVTVERFRYAPRAWETLAYSGDMAQQVRRSVRAQAALTGFLAAGARATARACRTFVPHVVHAHWWFPGGVLGLWGGAPARRPLVTTLHGSDVRLAAGIAPARAALRRVLARSRAVTTVSRWLAREVARLAPASAPRVAPMPVATELFTPAGPPAPGRVLFVGRLNAQKGIDRLLEAVAGLPPTVTLDVVGDGPAREAMRARAHDLGVAARVTWHGAQPQPALADFYRRATVLAVPSIDEGLGLVVVEAQLCGTPAVAFASGGLPDLIDDGRTGVLVPPGDREALRHALARVLGDGALREQLGREGRNAALARFAPAAAARTYAALYREVLGA